MLLDATQDTRPIAVSTPLGKDVLLLRSFEGREAISQLFSFELDLLSKKPSINFQDIVGQRVSLRVSLADGGTRYWNGFVSRFMQTGPDVYRATVVPWLWFLTQTTDCRIFQNKSATDIIKQLFQEYKFPDYSLRLKTQCSPREYSVQYRETDLNFISRLMEEEGIFYFFEHEENKHTLILCDDSQACQPCPHQAKARHDATSGGRKQEDVIQQWLQASEYCPGVYTATDYNFETPTTSLLSTANGQGKYEIYDFPGDYQKRTDGNTLARMRLEEQQLTQTLAQGISNCRAFGVGYKFELEDHYRQDLNQEYVLTALHHSGRDSQDYRSGSGSAGAAQYSNRFRCVPAKTPIRPARRTPVPMVQGCQTAMVVGPAGEEIFTDRYGRVKVQFHWDREGSNNENSSCWMRVSYPWSGKGFGGIQIPRIGQEVIVDFIEGDPDRPIITGRVYNAAQMPPWDLPGQKMVSGYKSNSTKGGGGFNEFSFDDTKGSELIQLHGQHDMDSKIEHDQRLHVVNDRTKNIDANEKTTIGQNRTEKVGLNENITVGANRTEKVLAHENVNVSLTRTHGVGINDMLKVGAAQQVLVGGFQLVGVGLARVKTVGLAELATIGAGQITMIGGSQRLLVRRNLSETTVGNHSEKVGKNRVATVAQNDTLTAGKKIVIDAKEEVVLRAGKASITLKRNGDILFNGKNLNIEQSGKIVANAKGKVRLCGSETHLNPT